MKNFIAAFVVTALTGCATGVGQVNRMIDMTSAMAQVKAASASHTTSAQVILNFEGTRAFITKDSQFAESFCDLSLSRGSRDQRETLETMGRVGALLKTNPDLQAYLYVPQAFGRDPVVRDYLNAIERTAGPGRVTIKTDARMSRSVKALSWIADPALSASPDALASAERRGLATKVQ